MAYLTFLPSAWHLLTDIAYKSVQKGCKSLLRVDDNSLETLGAIEVSEGWGD